MLRTGRWLGNLQITFITIKIYNRIYFKITLSEKTSACFSFIHLGIKDVRYKRDSQKVLISPMYYSQEDRDPANPVIQLPWAHVARCGPTWERSVCTGLWKLNDISLQTAWRELFLVRTLSRRNENILLAVHPSVKVLDNCMFSLTLIFKPHLFPYKISYLGLLLGH